jgi:hypothetical protein
MFFKNKVKNKVKSISVGQLQFQYFGVSIRFQYFWYLTVLDKQCCRYI